MKAARKTFSALEKEPGYKFYAATGQIAGDGYYSLRVQSAADLGKPGVSRVWSAHYAEAGQETCEVHLPPPTAEEAKDLELRVNEEGEAAATVNDVVFAIADGKLYMGASMEPAAGQGKGKKGKGGKKGKKVVAALPSGGFWEDCEPDLTSHCYLKEVPAKEAKNLVVSGLLLVNESGTKGGQVYLSWLLDEKFRAWAEKELRCGGGF